MLSAGFLQYKVIIFLFHTSSFGSKSLSLAPPQGDGERESSFTSWMRKHLHILLKFFCKEHVLIDWFSNHLYHLRAMGIYFILWVIQMLNYLFYCWNYSRFDRWDLSQVSSYIPLIYPHPFFSLKKNIFLLCGTVSCSMLILQISFSVLESAISPRSLVPFIEK